MRNVILFSLLIFCTTCTTYDNALIYHRNFVSGTHPLLRFDGYYTDTSILGKHLNEEYYTGGVSVKPVFFYSNGSVFSSNNFNHSDTLQEIVKTNRLVGSWGNYLIEADTIQLEKFQKIENNYQRIILRGIITKDKIHWTGRKEHNEKFKDVDYSIYFHPSSLKPDSIKNFTRTKKKYNKY